MIVKRFNKKGMTIPLAMMAAVATAFLILSLTQSVKFSAHEAAYFGNQDSVYRIAESGLYDAISNLTINPDLYLNGGSLQGAVIAYEEGTYQNYVEMSNAPGVEGGYYVLTISCMTQGSNTHVTHLHSHVKISNAAEYFWAVNGLLMLAAGTDAETGKVYANQLQFIVGGGATTKVQSAEYLSGVVPDCDVVTPCPYGAPGSGEDVEIGEPTSGTDPHEPVKLDASIIFPQVLDSDIDKYKSLAHVGTSNEHSKCDFQDDPTTTPLNEIHIYPPGYESAWYANDDYPSSEHTNNVLDHVYFCPGEVTIGHPTKTTYIHGQVIVVATGGVIIEGNVINTSDPLPDPASVTYGSSTAHQLVVITPGDVTIGSSFHPPTSSLVQTLLTLQMAILAPYGRMSATPNLFPVVHDYLSLDFTGSMILNEIENWPSENFGTVFQGNMGGGTPSRTYKYMDSLKTHPPPYLPAIVEVHYSMEDSSSEGSVF